MSKISRLINRQSIKTILSSSSHVSITKPTLKNPYILTSVRNFSRIQTPKQSFLFSRTRVVSLSFNSNPGSFCSSSSPHCEIERSGASLKREIDCSSALPKSKVDCSGSSPKSEFDCSSASPNIDIDCSSSSTKREIEVNHTCSEEVTDVANNKNNDQVIQTSPEEVNDGADNIKNDHLSVTIPVRAYFMFNRIDLKGLMAENQANLIPHTSEKTYAVLKFGNAASQTPSPDSEANLSESSHSYMVVFPYGSTVMFNVHDNEVDGYLKIIKRHASGLPGTNKDGVSFQNYHIKYEVKEKSNLPMWMQGGQGCVMLQQLDIDGIRVISSVLGQSIALDYYIRKVDGVIAAFTKLSRGKRTRMREKRMFQLLGRANSTLSELVLKVGLFERPEIAFREDPNYSHMLEYLKDQFEFDRKFVGLDFYARLMETFIRFLEDEMLKRYWPGTDSYVYFICLGLLYFYSPGALTSLANTIIAKTNIKFT